MVGCGFLQGSRPCPQARACPLGPGALLAGREPRASRGWTAVCTWASREVESNGVSVHPSWVGKQVPPAAKDKGESSCMPVSTPACLSPVTDQTRLPQCQRQVRGPTDGEPQARWERDRGLAGTVGPSTEGRRDETVRSMCEKFSGGTPRPGQKASVLPEPGTQVCTRGDPDALACPLVPACHFQNNGGKSSPPSFRMYRMSPSLLKTFTIFICFSFILSLADFPQLLPHP